MYIIREDDPERRRRRRGKIAKMIVAAIVGALIGLSCPFWPEPLQPACRVVAKIVAVLVGGS